MSEATLIRATMLQPQGCLGRGELQAERLRYGAVGDATLVYVEPIAQMRVLRKRAPHAFVRKRQHERKRHIVERESGRAGNCARQRRSSASADDGSKLPVFDPRNSSSVGPSTTPAHAASTPGSYAA